ncbi:glycosyltransferase family 20-domain-containing protein [Mycena epipterygia]|nr:glycosyltransferase family 20-domain-containing protein [Mycena epipterygia]
MNKAGIELKGESIHLRKTNVLLIGSENYAAQGLVRSSGQHNSQGWTKATGMSLLCAHVLQRSTEALVTHLQPTFTTKKSVTGATFKEIYSQGAPQQVPVRVAVHILFCVPSHTLPESIFLVNVDSVGSNQMHQICVALRSKGVVLMGKNTMVHHVLRSILSEYLKIGFFLHMPFPSSEIYRILPGRHENLLGILYCDLIGFHTYGYARHFISSCTRILTLPTMPNGVEFEGRLTHVSIELDSFIENLQQELVITHIRQLEFHFSGVNRLDMGRLLQWRRSNDVSSKGALRLRRTNGRLHLHHLPPSREAHSLRRTPPREKMTDGETFRGVYQSLDSAHSSGQRPAEAPPVQPEPTLITVVINNVQPPPPHRPIPTMSSSSSQHHVRMPSPPTSILPMPTLMRVPTPAQPCAPLIPQPQWQFEVERPEHMRSPLSHPPLAARVDESGMREREPAPAMGMGMGCKCKLSDILEDVDRSPGGSQLTSALPADTVGCAGDTQELAVFRSTGDGRVAVRNRRGVSHMSEGMQLFPATTCLKPAVNTAVIWQYTAVLQPAGLSPLPRVQTRSTVPVA